MHEVGDLFVTVYEAPVYKDEFCRRIAFSIDPLTPLLYLRIQNPTHSRALYVLTPHGVGWIGTHHVVIYLDAAGEEVDLEETQGFVGKGFDRARKAIDAFAQRR